MNYARVEHDTTSDTDNVSYVEYFYLEVVAPNRRHFTAEPDRSQRNESIATLYPDTSVAVRRQMRRKRQPITRVRRRC